MNGNSRMQKSMALKKVTVSDDGSWTKYQNSSSCHKTRTFKNGSFGRCNQQQKKQQQQHQHERWVNLHNEKRVVEDPNSVKPDVPVYSNHDAIIGHELVRQYYTVLYNAPEHLWRFYSEHAQYCHENADGLRVVVKGRSQVRGLLETTVEKGHNRPMVVVKSVSTIRYAPDQLLVMATSEQFIQSFVVEFKTPNKLAVVASIVHPAFTERPSSPAVGVGRDTKTDHGVGGCPVSEDRQLFVGRLSGCTTSKHLRRTFGEYGEIVDVRIMSGHNRSGKPSKYNYAFVVFSRPESLEAALASELTELCNGNRVNVQRSKGRRRIFPEGYSPIDH